MKDLTRRLAMAGLLVLSLPAAVLGAEAVESLAPEEAAEPSTSGVDLALRAASDVPLFAGPATLRIRGITGTYRWQHVRFGADEVSATVTLVGDGEACTARLRLIGDGEAIADAWFESASEAKEEIEATLAVDYASARLTIDSDCRAWSVRLVPLSDSELEYALREKYYPVRGDSIEELIAATQHIDGKWAAYTEWFTTWGYSIEEGENRCRVGNGRTEVEATITYPDWKRPRGVDAAVAAEWQDFVESLRVHEQGHVSIALQGAAAIDDRLDEGFIAPTCDESAAQADAAAHDILQRYNRRSDRYDDATSHGATQGATLG